MKLLQVFVSPGELLGLALVILGYFLIPFIIGVPIFIVGVLLLVVNFYKKWIDIFVTKSSQDKLREEVIKSFEPHKPALTSLKMVGKEIIITSAIVFGILISALYIMIRR